MGAKCIKCGRDTRVALALFCDECQSRRDTNYLDAKVLRNEIESYISAGASDAEIRAAMPCDSRCLLAVVRILVDELQVLEGQLPAEVGG
jgi:hypothetical protein